MTTRGCRLGILVSHPIPYFAPLYRELAKCAEIDLEVLYYSDYGVRPVHDRHFDETITWDTDLLGGYRHRFLKSLSPIKDPLNPFHAFNPAVVTRVARDFDAILIHGYMHPSNILALLAAKLSGTTILMRTDMPRVKVADLARRKVKAAWIRSWIRAIDGVLFIGESNRQAYLQYGARNSQLFFCPHSIDVRGFRAGAAAARKLNQQVRSELGIDQNRTVVLFVGKLIEWKRPDAMLALAEHELLRDRIHVLVAGSGPLLDSLRKSAKASSLPITFLGFVNQAKLPGVYGLADVFVLPSDYEPWGLVVNEAMAAGVVPIVSSEVGAREDLIIEGQTGFSFPRGDWNALAGVVRELADNPSKRATISSAATQHIESYDHSSAAKYLVSSLRQLGLVGQEAKSVGQLAS